MRTPALTRTRIVVGTVMAAATIATTGLAASLALTRTEQQAEAATDQPSSSPSTAGTSRHTADGARSSRKTATTQTFTPTRPAPNTSGTTHTKTKGS